MISALDAFIQSTKDFSQDQLEHIANHLLHDPLIEYCAIGPLPNDADWIVEVSFKQGVTDNTGKIAQLTCEDYLGAPFHHSESVHSSTQYLLKGDVSRSDVEEIALRIYFRANPLIEEISINNHEGDENGEYKQNRNNEHKEGNFRQPEVESILLCGVNDAELLRISKQRQLVLTLDEMQAIQRYYENPSITQQRAEYGLQTRILLMWN